jgi:hypothetical protein
MSWSLTILVLAACLAGLLDWRIHLPESVRVSLLTGVLGSTGLVAYRLIRPLTSRTDDLSLALRIEEHYPALNDSLASAVEFLEAPDDGERLGSPALRQAAIKRALSASRRFDINKVVDAKGLPAAGLSVLAAGGLAIFLALGFPGAAHTALFRLVAPYGGYEWPRETEIEIQSCSRVPRGEAFDFHARILGVIPPRAVVEYHFDAASQFDQTYEIARQGESDEASFTARLDPGRVQQDFQFRVRAHDAVSPWHNVSVRPPPVLVPLGGRASPQIYLTPPSYTDLLAQSLPDGLGNIEAVAGTGISLSAAVDRPLVRAWLAFPREREPAIPVAAWLAAVGSWQPLANLFWIAAAPDSWKQIPARLNSERTSFTIDSIARWSGDYVLHFEDEIGMESTRIVELHVVADPAPAVHLERPSRSKDSLELLPDAELTLQVRAEDPLFAVRSVWLEHSVKRSTKSNDGPAADRLLLYEHAALELAGAQLFLAHSRIPLPLPLQPWRLRPQRLEVARRWPIAELRLHEGDVLVLQACADDFDDVAVRKKPGRSEEVEIRITSRLGFDLALSEAQTQIQQELLRLQKLQHDALAKIMPLESSWRDYKGHIPPKQLDALLQAEERQQQLKSRIGNSEEGIRATAARILQALRDNHIPRSEAHDRVEAIDREFDRLSRENLPQIESLLARVRQRAEAVPASATDPAGKESLTEARKQQEEVAKALGELLKLLEPWSNSLELNGEAKSILEQQHRLHDQVQNLQEKIPPGSSRESLPEPTKVELEKATEQQNILAERTAQLVEKLGRLARESLTRKDPSTAATGDPERAKRLQEASARGEQTNASAKMQEAARSIQQNKLSTAESQQRQSVQALDEVIAALEERSEEGLDRLIQRLKEAEEKLGILAEQEDRLAKKVKNAQALSDPTQRAAELQRLSREQQELQTKMRDMVRELNRLRADRAEQALSQASGRMERAGRQMPPDNDDEDAQRDILERMNEAREQLAQARADAEESLAREKIAKVGEQIKGLKKRQQALLEESVRIHRELLQQNQWTRALLSTLGLSADAQKELSEETEQFSRDKLAEAKVFAHLLTRASEAMKRAAKEIDERRDEALEGTREMPAGDEASLDVREEQSHADAIQRWQGEAVQKIDQLLDALKPTRDERTNPPEEKSGAEKKPSDGEAKTKNTPSLPPPGELKVLLSLQREVNERTRGFNNQHPDNARLSEPQKQELKEIRKEQQDVADLFHEIMTPPDRGDRK